MLDQYPNFYIDLAARLMDLGRQPRATASLINKHPDRVLFGTDASPLSQEDFQLYFRFLESNDEYFPYSTESIPPNGRWAISGLALPDNELQMVYGANAKLLISGFQDNLAYLNSDFGLKSDETPQSLAGTKETI